MALAKKTYLACLVFTLLALDLINASLEFESLSPATTEDEGTYPQQINCGAACDVRCSKASRQKICKRACGTCCARCHCVPSGTSGNYDQCPCYKNMTTHGGRRKCP